MAAARSRSRAEARGDPGDGHVAAGEVARENVVGVGGKHQPLDRQPHRAGEVAGIGSALKGQWKEGDRVSGFPFICCGDATPCKNFVPGQTACSKGTSVGLGQSHGGYAEFVKIGGTGAYCASMAAHGYNSYPATKEVIV